MDNTSECAISNTVIRNISAAGSVDAYGVMMIGTTIKPRLTDTTIRTILGGNNSVGIFMENAHNPSFDPTLIENVTASNGTAFGILMAVTDGSFYDTTIRDIAGNKSAYGILMIPAINVTFDLTLIERVNASAPNGEAYGILAETINGSFSNTTISDIAGNLRARGIDMNATSVAFDPTVIERVTAPDGYACGIWMDPVVDGSFVDTTIRDIAGNITARGIGMNAFNVTFDPTVIERVNGSNGFAYGIDAYYLINGSFTDTMIHDISGYYEACGIIMSDAENVSFDPTVIERVTASAPNGPAFGIFAAIINGSFTDTTISDIFGYDGAAGIIMDAENVSFDPTVIERVNAPNGPAYGIIAEIIDSSFTDTTISDIVGYDIAAGIYMLIAENVSFDPTVIERVNASNGAAFGIIAAIIDSSFTDTTIRDIAGNSTACGIYMYSAINVSFLTGELTNCGHGLWLEYGDNNRIEEFIIRDNTLFDTGVHLETDASNTTVCRNCFFNNVLQAWDNGTNNIWIGNFWEPEPGEFATDPYLIPGNALSRDNKPLQYCPLCVVEVPVLTPFGLLALVGLLSAVVAMTIATRKRR